MFRHKFYKCIIYECTVGCCIKASELIAVIVKCSLVVGTSYCTEHGIIAENIYRLIYYTVSCAAFSKSGIQCSLWNGWKIVWQLCSSLWEYFDNELLQAASCTLRLFWWKSRRPAMLYTHLCLCSFFIILCTAVMTSPAFIQKPDANVPYGGYFLYPGAIRFTLNNKNSHTGFWGSCDALYRAVLIMTHL